MAHAPLCTRLEKITGALLLAMGVTGPAACGGEVVVPVGAGGGSGVGSTTSGGVTTSGVGSSSMSSGGGTDVCVDPQPVVVAGQDVGVDLCAGGQLRRRAEVACPEGPPSTETCCGECPDGSICEAGGFGCTCVETCDTDADCGPDQLCLCGPEAGLCVPASCQTDADCTAGQACTSWDVSQGCGLPGFDCTDPGDACGGDLDCDDGQMCSLQADGVRSCMPGGCAIGRPFLVEGIERTAPLTRRSDWCLPVDPTVAEGLHVATRQALAEHWRRVGAMEHASIAAFARFALQLLAFGAPPDLLERTHVALADETRHARAAFALASAYAGEPVGPGPLPIEDAMAQATDVERFVSLLLHEGCVGETVAAVEAAEATPSHPAVASVLEAIAVEEGEHAELAWRTLAWMLDAYPEATRRAIDAAWATLDHEAPALATPNAVLTAQGIPDDVQRQALRSRVIAAVVLPCLDALVASRQAAGGGATGVGRVVAEG